MVEYNKQSKVKHETEINKQVEEYEKKLAGVFGTKATGRTLPRQFDACKEPLVKTSFLFAPIFLTM